MRIDRMICFGLLGVGVAAGSIAGIAQRSGKTGGADGKRGGVDMTPVRPESVGFSSERLERLHALIQDEIEQKKLVGAVTILARHGEVVEYRTYGKKDSASGAEMTKDTIFRDYSMTKPVTGVAMMVLYEEGKWQPSDPVSKYVPELAHLKVFKGR